MLLLQPEVQMEMQVGSLVIIIWNQAFQKVNTIFLHKDVSLKADKGQFTKEFNDVVALLIRFLKCMKMIKISIEKSYSIMRHLSTMLASLKSNILLGHVKTKVYDNSPAVIQDLKEEIREAIDEMRQPLCKSVMKIYMKRIRSLGRGRGSH